MRILIDKALKYIYMLYESLIVCKHGNILLFLILKENTSSKCFTIYIQHREQTYKLKSLSIYLTSATPPERTN